MLIAVRRRLAALDVEVRSPRAETMRATQPADIHHAILSMLPAEGRRLATFDIEVRPLNAELV